jgi:hypothetical protein
LGTKRFAKILGLSVLIAIASMSFGGPVFAAMKVGTAHLAQLAGSPGSESAVLALIGAGFLTVAFAVRRLQPSTKQGLS